MLTETRSLLVRTAPSLDQVVVMLTGVSASPTSPTPQVRVNTVPAYRVGGERSTGVTSRPEKVMLGGGTVCDEINTSHAWDHIRHGVCSTGSLATVTVSTAELRRSAMPASGMVTVAVQVYCPPSDALSGESVWFRADVFI